jgi:hypothetical protein
VIDDGITDFSRCGSGLVSHVVELRFMLKVLIHTQGMRTPLKTCLAKNRHIRGFDAELSYSAFRNSCPSDGAAGVKNFQVSLKAALPKNIRNHQVVLQVLRSYCDLVRIIILDHLNKRKLNVFCCSCFRRSSTTKTIRRAIVPQVSTGFTPPRSP